MNSAVDQLDEAVNRLLAGSLTELPSDAEWRERIEIATALRRNIPVIPILLEDTRVPKAERLPDELKPLSRRNGLEVRSASFHGDMDRLVRGLRGHSGPQTK